MDSKPTIRQRFNADLQNRLALIAYVPTLCLGVLAAGGLIFLRGSTGVRVFGIFALLGIALSIFIAYRTISSIIDLLGRVAESAQGLVDAQHALLDNDHEPIGSWPKILTDSDDEIGQLAASVNAMHTNTVEVDRNQNESIKKGISNIVINLARRSQALLDRQVEYIDALESSEEDPDRLEQMFKVDHLATRMRRNAESLLVLADADAGRRRGGPVDVADVLRVAMGEIENYQHIELNSVEPGQVTSAAAVDLAHMAAELMENATQFSPPDTPVEVSGRLDGEQYVVSIVDHGMGMPAAQLVAANDTLQRPPDLGLAMERSLGFVVIGRLAQRLGAVVKLTETPNSGVTASIFVPTAVFSKVGNNSGVRRSIVSPDVTDAPIEQPDPGDQENSPALTKLLGLDASSLGAPPQSTPSKTSTPATATTAPEVAESDLGWTPPPVTPDGVVVEVVEPIRAEADVAPVVPIAESDLGWTPPPVTPDGVVVEVVEPIRAEVDVAPVVPIAESDSGWTPPPVTPDGVVVEVVEPIRAEVDVAPVVPIAESDSGWMTPPLTPVAEVVEPNRAEVDVAPVVPIAESDSGWMTPPVTPDGVVVEVVEPIEAAVADVAEAEARTQAETHVQAEAHVAGDGDTGPTQPATTTPSTPAEKVPEGLAPSNLEEAIPTGDAFESGMASLLDKSDAEDSDADESASAAAEPQTETSSGLTRRRRGESRVPIGEGRPVAASTRKPEEIRSMLSSYRDGIKGNTSPAAEPPEEE